MSELSLTPGRLRGQTAVITGAASGLGAATARRFVAEGARVVAVDRSGEALSNLVTELGEAVHPLCADVSSEGEMEAMAGEALKILGDVDVVFANAGIEGVGRADSCPVDQWATVLAVNLTGVFLTSRFLLPAMIARGSGSIVNTASVAALVGVPNILPYTAAKGGVAAMTRQMAVDLSPQGIRVNAICPGTVMTPLVTRNWEAKGLTPKEALAGSLGNYPLRRTGEPADIAALVAFLSCSDSGWITGAVIPIDGGYTAR
ncbi:MAG: SDR family NAD(P)-dependent oxidoreductase [Nostocoides sp.]